MSTTGRHEISRREFIRRASLGATGALVSSSLLGCSTTSRQDVRLSGAAGNGLALNGDWLFGGKFTEPAAQPGYADTGFERVTLPHCAAKLSWQKWEPASWEDVWIYRRHFSLPDAFRTQRVFLHLDGVTVGATPFVNGQALTQHLGGYLPFHYEISQMVKPGENLLAVAVDGRWLNTPPEGSPKGYAAVDYYIPAGITRPVSLRSVPQVFIRNVFARPVAVLEAHRRVDVTCTLDAAVVPGRPVQLRAELLRNGRRIAGVLQEFNLEQTGTKEVLLTLTELGNISLWEPANPQLYNVLVTLTVDTKRTHAYSTRIGFREARFERDGFFLNGGRLQLFGLDRHELYPYVASAMPARVVRRDAELLRRDFNCNIVRCSHYPQSDAFLDACDELGLMVWEELPGWQYIGDAPWQDLAVRDVEDMVRRDRNRPSVVIWGVRINESANNPELYRRTKAAAKALDPSRQTSGAMNRYSTKDWLQDVYTFDDYHAAPDGSVGVKEPLPDVPYFLSEAVGQFAYGTKKGGFGRKYRRAGELSVQQAQALAHAQVHDRAAANPRIGGVIAWCAFDYGSPINSFEGLKCPGIADIFRIPKLGASFYRAQIDPNARVVIEPNFYWDFGPQSPNGPGKTAAIFSNCDRLELFIDGKHHSTARPHRGGFPNLAHPPFFADLTLERSGWPELRVDGYLGAKLALSRSFSSDASADRFLLQADDKLLVGDGSDATRLVFGVVDKFGAPRAFAGGAVDFAVRGPARLVGDNPFSLAETGGFGAVWLRAAEGGAGKVHVTAKHSSLGTQLIEILVAQQRG